VTTETAALWDRVVAFTGIIRTREHDATIVERNGDPDERQKRIEQTYAELKAKVDELGKLVG
jgi:hypothetical protein